jgi:hypothetical protein
MHRARWNSKRSFSGSSEHSQAPSCSALPFRLSRWTRRPIIASPAPAALVLLIATIITDVDRQLAGAVWIRNLSLPPAVLAGFAVFLFHEWRDSAGRDAMARRK